MADVIGLGDVSSEDTGKGSQLKTGNLKRSYNMAAKCKSGQVYSQKLKKCIPAPKSATSGLKDKPGGIGEFDKPGSMYRAEQRRSM